MACARLPEGVDADARTAYLETDRPENLAFYGRIYGLSPERQRERSEMPGGVSAAVALVVMPSPKHRSGCQQRTKEM